MDVIDSKEDAAKADIVRKKAAAAAKKQKQEEKLAIVERNKQIESKAKAEKVKIEARKQEMERKKGKKVTCADLTITCVYKIFLRYMYIFTPLYLHSGCIPTSTLYIIGGTLFTLCDMVTHVVYVMSIYVYIQMIYYRLIQK